MDDYNQLAGRQAEFIERIPPKAAIWDSLQTELALHARTKKLLEVSESRERLLKGLLDQANQLYADLKREVEDAMSMALEPEEIEKRIPAASANEYTGTPEQQLRALEAWEFYARQCLEASLAQVDDETAETIVAVLG